MGVVERDSKGRFVKGRILPKEWAIGGMARTPEAEQIRRDRISASRKEGFANNRIVFSRHNLGKNHSEEHKTKISEAIRRLWQDPEYKQRVSAQISIGLTGSRASAEARARRSGAGNPNWRGGSKRKFYPIEFFRLCNQIRGRDNHTCQRCYNSSSGRGLDIHHIDGDTGNNTLDNLISLCRRCHTIVDHERRRACFATN